MRSASREYWARSAAHARSCASSGTISRSKMPSSGSGRRRDRGLLHVGENTVVGAGLTRAATSSSRPDRRAGVVSPSLHCHSAKALGDSSSCAQKVVPDEPIFSMRFRIVCHSVRLRAPGHTSISASSSSFAMIERRRDLLEMRAKGQDAGSGTVARQGSLGLPQDALPRNRQEPGSWAHDVGTRQPLRGAPRRRAVGGEVRPVTDRGQSVTHGAPRTGEAEARELDRITASDPSRLARADLS